MTVIKPESLDIGTLPFVSYNERENLPACNGIYFVIQNDRLVYIGSAKNINRRFYRHDKRNKFTDCQVAYTEIDLAESLLDVERSYIHYFKPELNAVYGITFDTGMTLYNNQLIRARAKAKGFKILTLAAKTELSLGTIEHIFKGKDVYVSNLVQVLRELDLRITDIAI